MGIFFAAAETNMLTVYVDISLLIDTEIPENSVF